jgi:uncharacterized protein YndB with AHSA1/START domain
MSSDNLIIKKVFNCNKRELFDAWSQPAVLSKWFFAATKKHKDSEAECVFSVGGSWSVTMYFADSSTSKLNGHYKEITRYSFISFSLNSPIATNSLVQLTFKELSANRTELKLVHSLFPSEDSKQMHSNGWDACLLNLEKLFNS